MTDKVKNVIKWSGVGAIILGSLALYFGGGTEGNAVEIVGASFTIVGLVISIIKANK